MKISGYNILLRHNVKTIFENKKYLLFHSSRLGISIHCSKKKTDENFFCTTHSELMRKKMVTKYSHIIPRTKIIRGRESQNEGDECRESEMP